MEGTPDEVINAIVKSIDSALGDTEQMKPLVEALQRAVEENTKVLEYIAHHDDYWKAAHRIVMQRIVKNKTIATMEQQEKKNG